MQLYTFLRLTATIIIIVVYYCGFHTGRHSGQNHRHSVLTGDFTSQMVKPEPQSVRRTFRQYFSEELAT